jgi:hypothetical protein
MDPSGASENAFDRGVLRETIGALRHPDGALRTLRGTKAVRCVEVGAGNAMLVADVPTDRALRVLNPANRRDAVRLRGMVAAP